MHDGLSPAFVERYTTTRIGFMRTRPGPWTTNDARFFAYQRLLGRVRAARVFLTDISDVTIVQDPFFGLECLGADLVAGAEILLPRCVRRASPVFRNAERLQHS